MPNNDKAGLDILEKYMKKVLQDFYAELVSSDAMAKLFQRSAIAFNGDQRYALSLDLLSAAIDCAATERINIQVTYQMAEFGIKLSSNNALTVPMAKSLFKGLLNFAALSDEERELYEVGAQEAFRNCLNIIIADGADRPKLFAEIRMREIDYAYLEIAKEKLQATVTPLRPRPKLKPGERPKR